MKTSIKTILCIVLSLMCVLSGIGYAAVSSTLEVHANLDIPAALPDVYITEVTPAASAGVSVTGTSGTLLSAKVTGAGTATFTVEVKNISEKIYVFERVMGGAEANIEGVYTGTDITCTLSDITALDEVAPNGGTRTFRVQITVPRNVTADHYVLLFKFIEKQGTEILPGNDAFDVTFKYNNGHPDTVLKVREKEFIPRPETPVRAGYSFIGWYTDSACSVAWNFDTQTVSGNLTLYAGWEAIGPTEYTVAFRPNNGDPNTERIVPANTLLEPPTSPTLEGYSFIGWYIDPDCTLPWNFDTDRVNRSLTLYGGWEIYVPPVPPELYITFQPNNGEPANTVMVLTGNFLQRPATPERSGYIFLGWYIDQTYTTAWNFEVNRVEQDMTLYAGWREIVEYTVIFKTNNGAPDQTVTVSEGMRIPHPEMPVREGFTFIGWYTDEDCTAAWNFDTDLPTSDMTLYAGWEENDDSGTDNEFHSDFLGLVEALLHKDINNSLNNSDEIYNNVIDVEVPKQYADHAPIFHCGVPSISGGTMSDLADEVNEGLKEQVEFVFMADANDPDRLFIYMYYKADCTTEAIGSDILVYFQVVSRDSNGVWYENGTYQGVATVGMFCCGYKNKKPQLTIDVYSWRAVTTFIERAS
ncbi:MAG: InlB B-repeat-containing protein [Clostridia bacterium]|nr:InlB B-repeat-containing protein [Clostridia bacterium]